LPFLVGPFVYRKLYEVGKRRRYKSSDEAEVKEKFDTYLDPLGYGSFSEAKLNFLKSGWMIIESMPIFFLLS
jgi:hypothetical protein